MSIVDIEMGLNSWVLSSYTHFMSIVDIEMAYIRKWLRLIIIIDINNLKMKMFWTWRIMNNWIA